MKETNDKETFEKGIEYIDYNVRNLNSIVNNVLGVTSLDSYNIKFTKNTYSIEKLIKEIVLQYRGQINDKIEFKINVSKSIPKTLYGDSVKLKQVINTILENAIKHTKQGFIEINVDAITRNEMCRLIISIEDSGIGMSLSKVNELLSMEAELNEEEIKIVEQPILNLNIATKIVKLLGGHIIIKSEENKGSEFTIVVEQRVKVEKSKEELKEYSKSILNHKRVLVVDNSKEYLEEITKNLKKYNVEISTTMYGSDCYEKIKSKEKYDLVLLDDEMEPDTGLSTFKKLKELKIKTPVVIMLEKGKEPIKHHYLEEGFKDYLLKDEIETEVKRIMEKYL